MPLNLDREKPQRWLELTGHLKGVEILIILATPKEGERFRQRLVRRGVVKHDRNLPKAGREDEYFQMIAETYILDWKGDVHPEGTPYSSEKMGAALGDIPSLFQQVMEAIGEDSVFFGQNGSA